MPTSLTWLLSHASASTPDAGFTDLPRNTTPPQYACAEQEPLLCEKGNPDECELCSRKRRRKSFQAYPNQSELLRKHVPRSKERGCARLFTQLKHLACCCSSRRRYQVLTRYRYHKQKKPFTAISVHVEQLTAEPYDEDDLAGVPDLIEVIRLQSTGPGEAARAIRKKLKYGSVHRQLRALTILDGILQNGGPRVQKPILADAPLQERLRIAAIDPVSDPDVRAKCKVLFGQWVASSQDNPGLEGAKALYNQLPKKQKAPHQRREQSKVLRETEEQARRDDEEDAPIDPRRSRGLSLTGESSSSTPTTGRKNSIIPPITLTSASTFGTNKKVKKDKKSKSKTFNIEKEKPAILQSIASSSVASTNLNNALKLLNREHQRVSSDPETLKRFETAKQLRRQILRYIQYVETEELLGGLIHANEELVASLMSYEVLDKSVDDDSDSEMEEGRHLSRQEAKREEHALREANDKIAGLKINPSTTNQDSSLSPIKPPRPTSISMPPKASPASGGGMKPPTAQRPIAVANKHSAREVDYASDLESASSEDDGEDNPFGDVNAARTPDPSSRAGFSWKEV